MIWHRRKTSIEERLRSRRARVRREALNELFRSNRPDIRRVLEESANDGNEDVRRTALFGLAEFEDPSAAPTAISIVSNPREDEFVRREAMLTIQALMTEVPDELARILNDEQEPASLRADAAGVIGRIGGRTAKSALERAAVSQSKAVRSAAKKALEE